MTTSITQRPQNVIKPLIRPISADTKTKVATAIQAVVSAIKAKHLA